MVSRLRRCAALALAALAAAVGLTPSPAAAELVLVSGRVIDAASSEGVRGATITAGEARTTSDAAGRFSLRLPEGAVRLSAHAEGFVDAEIRVTVPPDAAQLEIRLVHKPRFAEVVSVTATEPSVEKPATIDVRAEQVLRVAGGGDNIFRVLQTLPGVAAAEDFGSRLSVRGGSPDQNLTIMDGVEIHNPYRLFGLTSAFNPETVERFELTAGGFGAKYGDRLSSLLVVDNRAGNDRAPFTGSSALSITDGNVVLEGKLPGRAKGSWLATGRRTYYDLVAERFVDDDLPAFNDLQLRTTWEPAPNRLLTFFALRSREDTNANINGDTPGETGAFLTKARNDLLSARFQTKVGGRGASSTNLAWYRNVDRLDVDARFRSTNKKTNTPDEASQPLTNVAFDRDLAVQDLSLRQELSVQASPRHFVEAGLEAHWLETSIAFVIRGDRNPTEANGSSVRGGAGLPDRLRSARNTTRLGAWIQDRFAASDRLTLEPGVRLDRSSLNGRSTLSPRLAANFRLSETIRVRAAGGLYLQSPGYEKLIQSDSFFDLTPDARRRLESERSTHMVLGLERSFGPGLVARVEAYYKTFRDIIAGRLETTDERLARLARYDYPAELAGEIPTEPFITSFPTNDGRGTAKGFDVYLARTRTPSGRGLTGWASYTFGIANRENYGRTYPFEYDRRHAFSLAGTHRFGPRFDVSATFRAASGFPRTPVSRVRVAATETADGRLVPERDAAGRLAYVVDLGGVSNLNSARLPLFARLDLRSTWRPRGAAGRWELYLDVINATNRKNAGALDPELQFDPGADRPRVVEKPTAAIPFLPSFGVRFRF